MSDLGEAGNSDIKLKCFWGDQTLIYEPSCAITAVFEASVFRTTWNVQEEPVPNPFLQPKYFIISPVWSQCVLHWKERQKRGLKLMIMLLLKKRSY